jgi:hypothetical protein
VKVIFVPAYVFLATLCAPAASAQVTINPAALVQLAGIAPPSSPTCVCAAPLPKHVNHRRVEKLSTAVIRAVAKPILAKPVIAQPATPTTIKPAPAAPPPKPLAPISIRFAPGSAALPAGAAAALAPYCAAPGQVAIDARAPGDPDDPSVAMRLSLSRALAVRDALAACGVPGTRILPRADGAVPGADENQAVVGVPGAK